MHAIFRVFSGIVGGFFRDSREVTQIKRKLKPRERLFCGFAGLGDAERAARKAGYTGDCKLKGDRLLCEEAILEEIDRQIAIRRKTLSRMATIGYQRLAFGSIADALRLLFAESPTEQELRDMDMFTVSDIRRNKDGMLEIKFFDRLRALEKLGADAKEDNAGVAGLMEAIGRGAMAAGGERPTATATRLSATVRCAAARPFACRCRLCCGASMRSVAATSACAAKPSVRCGAIW